MKNKHRYHFCTIDTGSNLYGATAGKAPVDALVKRNGWLLKSFEHESPNRLACSAQR
jgi:hypothetical protein